MIIKFSVDGEPKAQQSVRARIAGSKGKPFVALIKKRTPGRTQFA